MDDITGRVARGAAWLDEARPGWVQQVDLKVLSMGDGCLCVLGQIYAAAAQAEYPKDFSDGTWDGFNYATDHYDDLAGADEYGFDTAHIVPNEAAAQEYQLLDAEWRRLISDRLAAVTS